MHDAQAEGMALQLHALFPSLIAMYAEYRNKELRMNVGATCSEFSGGSATMAPLRWGIFATGLIAQDFATALRIKPANHDILAVGGRSPQKVEEFAKRFNIKNQFTSCEQLAACPEVDAVYIASLTNLHYEHAKVFLNAGKHILCEKPFTLNAAQTRELHALSREKKRFAMVGIWSRFFPAYQRLRAAIDSGELGEVKVLQANFCLPNAGFARLAELSTGGGLMADFGVYLTHLACWVFKSERPASISVSGHHFPSGADRSGVVTLRYSDKRIAALTYSCDCGPYAKAVVIGTKANAELGDLIWCATRVKIGDKEFHEPTPQTKDGKWNYFECGGLLYEADHVKECVDKGLIESPILPHSDSELIHDILEECYSQLGVKYPL